MHANRLTGLGASLNPAPAPTAIRPPRRRRGSRPYLRARRRAEMAVVVTYVAVLASRLTGTRRQLVDLADGAERDDSK